MTNVTERPITDADLREMTGIRAEPVREMEPVRQLPPTRPSWVAVWLAVLVAIAAVSLLAWEIIDDVTSDGSSTPATPAVVQEVVDPAIAEHTVSPWLIGVEPIIETGAQEHTVSPWLLEVEPFHEVEEHTVSPWLVEVTPRYFP